MPSASTPRKLCPWVLVFLCLTVARGGTFAQADAEASAKVQPPGVLIELGLIGSPEGELAERAGLGWSDVLESVEPSPWPEVRPVKPHDPLPRQAAQLIEQSEAAAQQGQAYRAVELLRQAEELAPDHPKLIRALGLAYAESGNLTRATGYLGRVVAEGREDVDAVLLLTRHAAETSSIEDVLRSTKALEELGAPMVADYFRAIALSRQGYSKAAAGRMSLVLQALAKGNLDKVDAKENAPPYLLREMLVIKQTEPQLRLKHGDWLLRSGAYDKAAEVYASVDLQDAKGRHALVARQVYLALFAQDKPAAVDLVLDLLREPGATDADAGFIAYLVEQGVSAADLSQQLEAMLQTDGSTLPRLVALSLVANKKNLLAPISRWLSSEPVSVERLAQGVALLHFDDREPEDAKPLTELLVLVAGLMERSPEQAPAYARATIDAIDAPVTLLRAIRSEAYAQEADADRKLLAAVAYEQAGRTADALQAHQDLRASGPGLAESSLEPVVRLHLALGQGDEAHRLLGEPKVDAPWQAFELAIRAMAAAGKHHGALAFIDERIKARGKQLHLDVLRIEVTAQMGQPQQACNLLLRLISSHPNEESLYRLGIDLAYDYSAGFSRLSDAERMRRAFLSRLVSNLPEAALSRISLAQNIRSNPARSGEAEKLLLQVLDEQPDNTGVLSLLVEIYDEMGNQEAAEAMFNRYTKAVGPGIRQAILIAERAVDAGDKQLAIEVLEEVFALEQEGVLPGPAMTGAQASSLLHYMDVVDEERDTDPLYLAMVRRFPDHAGLNNALGYRWTVQNKNLLQAKAMIQRALKDNPMNHSILDSLAWVQYKLGELDEAHATQSRALLILEAQLPRPGQPLLQEDQADYAATIAILNDHMGDILYKRGETRKAVDHWRTAQKQNYTEEQMQFDPELRTLKERLEAKLDAMAKEQPVPVADVPGPEAHGPEGHPADQKP